MSRTNVGHNCSSVVGEVGLDSFGLVAKDLVDLGHDLWRQFLQEVQRFDVVFNLQAICLSARLYRVDLAGLLLVSSHCFFPLLLPTELC